MKRLVVLAIMLLAAALVLILAAGMSQAQGTNDSPLSVDASSNYIPIQGRLTDASGNPLNGTYNIAFRLYGTGSGGTALCENTKPITVANGLFNTYMLASACPIDGRQLYLGIQVGSDPEMTPRQFIDNVPYAWSLRPGAVISDTTSGFVVQAKNYGSGTALLGQSVDPGTSSIGVEGTSLAGVGVKGEGFVGVGIQGDSFSGVAVKASGTGIIQSSAESYVWISGNGARPFRQSDSTIIDMTNTGGARIYRGATAGAKNVMIPIIVPGQLYGQNVTVSAMDIYWAGNTDFDAITAVLLRRQTGVCQTSSCYASLLHDANSHICEDTPTGCTLHYNLSTNNELSASSGVLYLTIEMSFSGADTWVDIGGVRLTLEHE